MARRVLWIAMEAFAGEHAQFPALRTTRAEALQCVKAETPDGGLLVVWVCYLNDQPPQYIAAPYVKTFTPAIAREEAYFTPPDLTPGEWLQQTVDKASTSVFK
ncbi:hypothetical protein PsYK624_031080 [Phanerochaete sordida]|uniref:Uncharacterized protein n=1 Tax=Phanerochaete sordida TaxID=48140 RepID=A0A9P3L9D4_9APHY|nr:hypothetical protein PsYK624_031080 [Phanerochaete sordida]